MPKHYKMKIPTMYVGSPKITFKVVVKEIWRLFMIGWNHRFKKESDGPKHYKL